MTDGNAISEKLTLRVEGTAYKRPAAVPSTEFLPGLAVVVTALVLLSIAALGCSRQPSSPDEKYGIEVVALHLTAGNHMVDLRYKIVDPQKAKAITTKEVRPYLVDSAGRRYFTPSAPKIGQLRNTGAPQAGRTYFALFANPGGALQRGAKVNVVIGDYYSKNLAIQ
jgi:hypothetical protein